MKRRLLISIGCAALILAGLVAVGLWSRRASSREQAIRNASLVLRNGNPQQVAEARRVLQAAGSNAIPVLAEAANRGSSAAWQLRQKTAPIVPRFLRSLLHRAFPAKDPLTAKLAAIRALGDLGTNAAEALPALQNAMADPQLNVSWEAMNALSQMGTGGVAALTTGLNHTNPAVRRMACYTFGNMGPNAAAASTNLVAALGDSDPSVVVGAAGGLARLGVATLGPLTGAVLSTNAAIRTNALQCLMQHRIAARASLPALVQLCGHPDAVTRQLAAQGIGLIFPWDADAVSALSRLLDDPNESVKIEAARSLRRASVRAESAIPRLTAMLADASPALREAAAQAFQNMGPLALPTLPALEKLRSDEVELVRHAASNSIAAILAAKELPRVPGGR